MQPKGKPETNKASSKAQTPPSQTSSPERETLQALVQRVSKLHYGCIDDAAIQYMQRIANKLHHHSQVPIRVSSIKEWMANLQTGTLLYGVNTIAPSLSFQLSKLLQRLSKEQEAGLKQSDPHNMAKALAGRIAITLAVDSLVRDLLPLAEHWTCFDPNFTGDKSGQTVYFNAIIEALKKHLPLLDRLEKVGPVRKVKAAYTNASKVVSSSKGGQVYDKYRKTLARMQKDLHNAVDAYQELYLKYLASVKNTTGRRVFRDMVPEDMLCDTSVSSSDAGSRVWWPRSARDYRRYTGRRGSDSSSGNSLGTFRSRPASTASSNGSSDPGGQRAAMFRTAPPARMWHFENDPQYLPQQPTPRPNFYSPPSLMPPPPASAAIENWRQNIAEIMPIPVQEGSSSPTGRVSPQPPPPAPGTFGPPAPLHPPMVYPPPPPMPAPEFGNAFAPLMAPPPPPLPPSARSGSPHPPMVPSPLPSRPPSSAGNRSARSGSDSSGGHWDSTMTNWPPPPPPLPEDQISWPDLPQAMLQAYKQLEAKDKEFRKAQAVYARIVRDQNSRLRKAHAFDELPRACCELLIFLHNNFDLHKKSKKPVVRELPIR